MENHLQHLQPLRALGSDAARDATELQRMLNAKMRRGNSISPEEMFAARSLMQMAAVAQSLYLCELERCHATVSARAKSRLAAK